MGAMLVAHSKFRHSHEPKTFSGARQILRGAYIALESRHSITPLKPAQPAYERSQRSEPALHFCRYRIPNRFLKVIIKTEIINIIIYLFQTYLRQGYYLKYFKKINIIILKRLKKGDYLELKLYKFIIFFNIFNKALEIIISRKLNNIAEEYKLLLL